MFGNKTSKKTIKFCISLFLLLFIFSVFFPVSHIFAQDGPPKSGSVLQEFWENLGITGEEGAGYEAPTQRSIPENIGLFISVVLGFVGVIFFALMIYAGMLWMTARGNEDQVKKARSIMTDSVVGFAITLAAYIITRTVVAILA